MDNLRLREVADSDLASLVADLRPLDRAEVEAASGETWADELRSAISISAFVLAAEDDDGLVALFGVKPVALLGDEGQPWVLGTSRMARHGRSLGLISRRYIAEVSQTFPLLANYVDARNTPSIRFLKWLGFAIAPARPFGVAGLPFHRFELRSDRPACAAPPLPA